MSKFGNRQDAEPLAPSMEHSTRLLPDPPGTPLVERAAVLNALLDGCLPLHKKSHFAWTAPYCHFLPPEKDAQTHVCLQLTFFGPVGVQEPSALVSQHEPNDPSLE